jgi:hypothetical protein
MAAKKPPPTAIGNPTGVYLKVPLPPELAALLGGHVERATEILWMLGELVAVAHKVGGAVQVEHAAIATTRKRLRARKRG